MPPANTLVVVIVVAIEYPMKPGRGFDADYDNDYDLVLARRQGTGTKKMGRHQHFSQKIP